MSNYSDIEFQENSDTRCPCVIVLDCSDSMTQKFEGESRSPLEELNSALDILVSEIYKDPLARRRAEISFIVYGTDVADPTDFTTLDSGNLVVPELTGMGLTYTAKALEVAISHLEKRKETYKTNGIPFTRPILLALSDGLAMDDLSAVSEKIKKFEKEKKLSAFFVGMTGADMDALSQIGTRPALKVSDGKLGELFQWLSTSVASVSASQPGDKVALPSPEGWAEL